MAAAAPVQMLWVGGALSALERLSVTSFLKNGHEVHLYTYGKPGNMPRGLEIMDAREILPEDAIFHSNDGYGKGSLTPFSELFRYTLLFAKGGIWADIDMICLRPLQFAADVDYIFASKTLPQQNDPQGKIRVQVSPCLFKTPPASALMQECIDHCRRMDLSKLALGEAGCTLLHSLVDKHQLTQAVLHPHVCCPIASWEMPALLGPASVLPPETHAVHCWHEHWRRNFFDKNADYDPLSLYQRLKNHFLGRKETPDRKETH